MICVNVFYVARKDISAGSDKRQRLSPSPTFTMGVYGENSQFFVGSNWNFVSGYIKNVDTHHEGFS